MTVTPQRIPPGARRELGVPAWLAVRVLGRFTGTGPPKLFRTLGRNRALFRGWLHFAGKLMPGGSLPRRETELVILRVAVLAGCAYEYEHHRSLGRRAGISDEEIRELGSAKSDHGATFSVRETAILDAVEQLHEHRNLDDDTWSHLRQHLDENEVIELIMLAGHYEMLATFINTLRISPDERRSGKRS